MMNLQPNLLIMWYFPQNAHKRHFTAHLRGWGFEIFKIRSHVPIRYSSEIDVSFVDTVNQDPELYCTPNIEFLSKIGLYHSKLLTFYIFPNVMVIFMGRPMLICVIIVFQIN